MYGALAQLGKADVVILEPAPKTAAERMTQFPDRVVRASALDRLSHARFRPDPKLSAAVEQALGFSLDAYRAIVGRNLWATTQIVVPPNVPLIGDLDDFHYRYSNDASVAPKVLVERLRKALSFRLARRQLPRMKGVFFATARDREENPEVESAVLPNIAYRIPETVRVNPIGERLLFVGSLWYRPNREALDWFVNNVWPRIRQSHSEAELRIVGAASEEVRKRWTRHSGVSAPGFAKDLASEYAAASVVIVPIQSGGGTNIKTLEALAYARPCVVSAFCHQAFSDTLRDEQHLLVAAGVEQFAAQCRRVLEDSQLGERIGRAGREAVCNAYSAASFGAIATDFVERICAKNPKEHSTGLSVTG